ncbi:MAG: hypothetical protein ACRCWY_04865 [Cellulosilyticaceae bacterium]
MRDMTFVQTDHRIIKDVLRELKVEMQALATVGQVDRVMVEIARGFILVNILDYHFPKEEEILDEWDATYYRKDIQQIYRLHGLSRMYYQYFEHYWRCFDEGMTLTKYDVIHYGESCIEAILAAMKIEERLFSLTMRDCIVK